ncbi:MAG: hypothetical protein KKC05_02820 [Nanoarchaeota archaeon]|nr:hypothetical protein [Nanoarchaeota archaeon]
MYYDNHVRFEGFEEAIKIAKTLGWSGVVLIHKWDSVLKPRNGKGIISGAEISGNPDYVRRTAQKIRSKFDVICVRGGDLLVNREAVENPLVDMLIQPWGDPIAGLRNDPGLNYVMIKLAKKNNVFIDFSLNDLIKSHKRTRVKLFSHMTKAAKLVRKYHAPFTLSSGALSRWDMRAPSDLKSFGKVLGFEDAEIKKAMSDVIVKENKKRISSRWIQPGIELV